MKRKALATMMAAAMVLSMVGCGGCGCIGRMT